MLTLSRLSHDSLCEVTETHVFISDKLLQGNLSGWGLTGDGGAGVGSGHVTVLNWLPKMMLSARLCWQWSSSFHEKPSTDPRTCSYYDDVIGISKEFTCSHQM